MHTASIPAPRAGLNSSASPPQENGRAPSSVRPLSRGATGLRMTVRSTIGLTPATYASAAPPAVLPTALGGPDVSTDADTVDMAQRQYHFIHQCVHDYREALLMSHACLEAGEGDEGNAPNSEVFKARLLAAFMAWTDGREPAAANGAGGEQGDSSYSRDGDRAEGADASRAARLDVPGQVLRVLAAGRRGSGRPHGDSRASLSGICPRVGDSVSNCSIDTSGSCSDSEGEETTSSSSSSSSCPSTHGKPSRVLQEGVGSPVTAGASRSRPLRMNGLLRRRYLRRCPTVRAPLLSTQPRYAALQQDMCTLARHLLVPLDVVQHHQHLWLFLSEDVPYTLDELLYHYRVVRAGVDGAAHVGVPTAAVASLWQELYEVLGAAWRQRGRLLGAYGTALAPAIVPAVGGSGGGAMTLTTARALPPFVLPTAGESNGLSWPPSPQSSPQQQQTAGEYEAVAAAVSASQAPPAADAGPAVEARYVRDVARFWRSHARARLQRENAHRRRLATATPPPPASVSGDLFSVQAYAAADTIGLGPLTPMRVGLRHGLAHRGGARGGNFVIREPLDGVWRALRCGHVVPESADALPHVPPRMACIPFFDLATDDFVGSAAVPYLSPEVYAELRAAAPAPPQQLPTHSFSDDVWSVAVMVMEAALSGFSVPDSHLGGRGGRTPTSSLYADTIAALVAGHGVALTAAHDFLYFTLKHFAQEAGVDGSDRATEDAAAQGQTEGAPPPPPPLPSMDEQPCPRRLAGEWIAHVQRTRGPAFFAEVVRPLCRGGLCWRRGERWAAFCAAHDPTWPGSGSGGAAVRVSPFAGAMGAAAGASTHSLDALAGGTPTADPRGPPTAVSPHASERWRERLEGVLDRLRIPLLPVLPSLQRGASATTTTTTVTAVATASPDRPWAARELWARLTAWRRQVEWAAIGAPHQSAVFTELVRLGREAVMSGAVTVGEGQQRQQQQQPRELRYAVANHPFVRGVIERGQLPAYCTATRTAAAQAADTHEDRAGGGPPPAAPLQAISLFIGQPTLDLLLSQTSASRRGRVDRAFASHDAEASTSALDDAAPTQRGSLQVLLGDTSRARPPGTLQAAAWRLTREVDVNTALQLRIVSHLRNLLYPTGPTPAPAVATAAAVRGYLIALHAEMAVPLVPVPPTLRGEVWAALLGIPAARARETAYESLRSARRTAFDRQISVDTPRCHPSHSLLASASGQAALQRVLRAWLAVPLGTLSGAPGRVRPAYWQGLDSVCAVLLSVSYTEEARVAAMLDAVVRYLVSYQDVAPADTGAKPPRPARAQAHGAGVGLAVGGPTPPPASAPPPALLPSPAGAERLYPPCAASMADALRQFGVTLRYVDPLLATHLDGLDCHPQLFAISWLLTLFTHGLPARQVHLLWDFLLLYAHDYPHCLACMCCAVLLQRRGALVKEDASGVLAALGGGASRCGRPHESGRGTAMDVVVALTDTAVLMRAMPPCIGHQPRHAGGEGTEVDRGEEEEEGWRGRVRRSAVAYMDMASLLCALRPAPSRERAAATAGQTPTQASAGSAAGQGRWWHSGLYLVDLRPAPTNPSPARSRGADRVLGAMRLPLLTATRPGHATAHHRDSDESARSRVAAVAAELLRQLQNPSMATVVPQPSRAEPASAVAGTEAKRERGGLTDERPDPSPFARKAAQAPHVVLLLRGQDDTDEDHALAEALALELGRCGVHNVSLLLGGVDQVRACAPWVVVPGVGP